MTVSDQAHIKCIENEKHTVQSTTHFLIALSGPIKINLNELFICCDKSVS